METNKSDTDTFFHESKKEKDDLSFELLTTNENHGIGQHNSTNADLNYKDSIVASVSADYHNHASNLEIVQENKTKEILPLIASNNTKKNPSVEITASDSNSHILATKFSSSDEQVGVLSSDEFDKHKHLEVLKYIETTMENKSFSSVNIASESDLETSSSSSAPSSAADSKEVAPRTLADMKSNNILDLALLNKEDPCLAAPFKTNDHTEMERLNVSMESKSFSTISAVNIPMPDLIDESTDSNSELMSSVKDFQTDSTSLMSDSSDATLETKFISRCANIKDDSSSTSRLSITRSDDITEPEASPVKVASNEGRHPISLMPQTKTNDDHKLSSSSSSSSSLTNEDFESVTSGEDVSLDNNPDSILPPPPIPDTCKGPENLPSGSDISKAVVPELDNLVLLSETVHDKLDNSESPDQCSFDQCKSNDHCSDKIQFFSNRKAQSVSASTSDNIQTTSVSNIQPITPPGDINLKTSPVSSLSSQVSSDQVIKAKKYQTW